MKDNGVIIISIAIPFRPKDHSKQNGKIRRIKTTTNVAYSRAFVCETQNLLPYYKTNEINKNYSWHSPPFIPPKFEEAANDLLWHISNGGHYNHDRSNRTSVYNITSLREQRIDLTYDPRKEKLGKKTNIVYVK